MVDFTVASPPYNGAQRLPKVLERLRSQIETAPFSWEVIVIDNNSKDNTFAVVEDYQQDWPEAFPLNYYFESQQGLVFARQRAIQEAKGSLVGFLDDDNLPAEDWVAAAAAFGKKYPEAGAYGGQIHGDFETNPPENFQRIKSFLSIRELGSEPKLYRPEVLNLPPGAALVVRRKAWLKSVPNTPALIGRINGSMLSGEDYESLLHLHKAGWEIWYNPAMHTYHQIPKSRLERDYLISLAKGVGLCIAPLRVVNAKAWQKPMILSRIILGNLRRAVLHWIKYRQRLKTDAIAACEMEFFLSSLISPFYLLRGVFAGSKD